MDAETKPQPASKQDESIIELLGRIATDSAGLVRAEVVLAKQEFKERLQTLKGGAIVIAFGAILGSVAFLTLWTAFVLYLCLFWHPIKATAVAGAGLAVLGAIVILTGINFFKKPLPNP